MAEETRLEADAAGVSRDSGIRSGGGGGDGAAELHVTSLLFLPNKWL